MTTAEMTMALRRRFGSGGGVAVAVRKQVEIKPAPEPEPMPDAEIDKAINEAEPTHSLAVARRAVASLVERGYEWAIAEAAVARKTGWKTSDLKGVTI
jgi:hypothetical protein